MSKLRVLVACEYSARVRDAFIAQSTNNRLTECRPLCNVEDMKYSSIAGFPMYRIREDGQLETNWRLTVVHPGSKIVDKWRVLPNKYRDKGYAPVLLRGDEGREFRTYIHRLVLEGFGPPKPEGKVCCRHLDGDSRNNHFSNLAWGSYKENENDKKGHGTYDTRKAGAKLTEDSRGLIREMRKKGMTMSQIAAVIGVSRPSVSRFLSGRTWA